MKPLSTTAKLFVACMAVCSIAVLGKALLNWGSVHEYLRFAAYMLVAVVAARFKVSLPRVTGSMSVNLPFILIALIELSLPEALAIAAVSTFVQTFWSESKKRSAVQVLFNVSVLVLAAQSSWLTMHLHLQNAGLVIASGALTILLTNTIPVAAIIAITEHGAMTRIWMQILHLTFPYYLLAGGIAGLVRLANHAVGWQMPLLVLPAMFMVYRSYRFYFQQMSESSSSSKTRAMTAGAAS